MFCDKRAKTAFPVLWRLCAVEVQIRDHPRKSAVSSCLGFSAQISVYPCKSVVSLAFLRASVVDFVSQNHWPGGSMVISWFQSVNLAKTLPFRALKSRGSWSSRRRQTV
jgi:hypothetical protein